MVYESDFYTTRRPYSSRPYVSSYSVTVRQIPHLPYCAHRKLVSIVHSPVRIYHAGTYLPIKIHSRVRPSIIAAELNRIRYLHRPSYVSHTEKYLNSKDYIDFDDETREIRAKTDNLLRRIHVFVPRPPISDYDETSPERLRSDDYIRRIINAKHARKDIEDLPWYSTPQKHRDIGSGHLACIKLVGGRPQSRRRPYYTVGDLVPGDVKSDVNLMSYYSKNRKAAEDAYPSPHVHHTERHRETHHAPAPSPTVTWADEVVKEEVEPEEEPMEQETAEVESKTVNKPKQDSSAEEEIQAAEYDDDGVKKTPDDDTIKKVQEYLDKKANEKKLEEERRAWEAAERKRIQEEKETARLAAIKEEEDRRRAEIKEQERIEAERQAVLQKAEEARQEAERLAEDEKLFNEAIAQAVADEKARVLQEELENEEARRKEEEEEDAEKEVVSSIAPEDAHEENELSIADGSSEGHSLHAEADISDQDKEAKPYEVDHDDDTQIEEIEHEEPEDEVEDPFTNAGEASANLPVEDEPVTETPKVRQSGGAGGEQGFNWDEYEDEVDAEETQKESQSVAEEAKDEADHQQVFENSDVESQTDAAETQVTECHEEYTISIRREVQETTVTQNDEEEVQETQEEEIRETTEAQKEVHESVEDDQDDATREEQEEVHETREEEEDDGEVTITEIQDEDETNAHETEEVKSEERLSQDVSEEEEEEEEE